MGDYRGEYATRNGSRQGKKTEIGQIDCHSALRSPCGCTSPLSLWRVSLSQGDPSHVYAARTVAGGKQGLAAGDCSLRAQPMRTAVRGVRVFREEEQRWQYKSDRVPGAAT
jgi:hypothetical protein